MALRDLQEYKQEIFRRSAEKQAVRRRIYKDIVAASLSIVLCVGLMAGTLRRSTEPESADKYTSGSIVCTYVAAEIRCGDEVRRITDKAAVTQIFEEVFARDEYENYAMPGEGNSGGYQVRLYEPDGRWISYAISHARGQKLIERLEGHK